MSQDLADKLRAFVVTGLSLREASRRLGISLWKLSTSTAGRQDLRLKPRLTRRQRLKVERLIEAGGLSYAAIARAAKCSKSTVLRLRDRKAEGVVGRGRYCRCATYRCPQCGGRVIVRPCPACELTQLG